MPQTTDAIFELTIEGTDQPHHYLASVLDSLGKQIAENPFEWREDSVATALLLGDLAKAVRTPEPPETPFHKEIGQKLFQRVLAGAVGELWAEQRKTHKRKGLRLVLRIHPKSARELLKLPWEYLHDGEGFLALDWHTPVSRIPWDVEFEAAEPLTESLRMLVMISAPNGLSDDKLLDTPKEEDLILESTREAQKQGRLEIVFAENATLDTLQDELCEYDPHILHFVGHGVYDPLKDHGILLMEDTHGNRQEVSNQQFADLLVQHGHSLRMVFLSACESAKVANTSGFAALGEHLLEKGIPAVLAMQYSVFNRSAMAFGSAFYQYSMSKPLQDAVVLARVAMQKGSPNGIDFGTPVLYLNDPNCLQVSKEVRTEAKERAFELGEVPVAKRFVGRASDLRLLMTHLDPDKDDWRAVVIHGLGGMGKTALAARLAGRMAPRLDGVKAIRMQPATTAKEALDQLAGFLLVHNAQFNHPQIGQFARIKDEAIPLENKVGLLVQILNDLRILVILDNYEDVLLQGQAVSQKAQVNLQALDPELPRLVQQLIEGVTHGSRFVITSRVDFEPVDVRRTPGIVGHLSLEELRFTEAAYLMESLPPLDALPMGAANGGLSKREVYRQVGGHPYTLNLLAEHAGRQPLEQALAGATGLKGELLAFTLLEKAAEQLPERAQLLLRRAAVYQQPAPEEGLAYLLGDEHDCMPEVGVEVQALLDWGLLVQLPGGAGLVMPALVQDWMKTKWEEQEQQNLLRKAAQYWLAVGRDSTSIEPELNARLYLFEAREYEAAGDIVNRFTELLERWGQYELLLNLLQQSVDTLEGKSKAVAMHNLGVILQDVGAYPQAQQLYEQSLQIAQELGDRAGVAGSLHQLGMLLQAQGEYAQAQKLYEQSLQIKQELGNRAGVAGSLHHLGNLLYLQGEYAQAQKLYEQSLQILQELGDRAGVAGSLHQLGNLLYLQGEYAQAQKLYEQSLQILQELGDRAGVASSLHQLGMLLQQQGEYAQAQKLYEQSLQIEQELGNRVGVASSLHQLGMLLQQQGEYAQAQKLYEQSLQIEQELGNRVGVASSLHNLGALLQAQGEYAQAQKLYEQSLQILQELGDRAGVASSLHQLGMLLQQQGEYAQAQKLYEQSLQIKQELGDRAGVASSLHQLGNLLYLQGEYAQAQKLYEQSLQIRQELGDQSGLGDFIWAIGAVGRGARESFYRSSVSGSSAGPLRAAWRSQAQYCRKSFGENSGTRWARKPSKRRCKRPVFRRKKAHRRKKCSSRTSCRFCSGTPTWYSSRCRRSAANGGNNYGNSKGMPRNRATKTWPPLQAC